MTVIQIELNKITSTILVYNIHLVAGVIKNSITLYAYYVYTSGSQPGVTVSP